MDRRSLSLHDFKKWMSDQKGMSEFFNIGDLENPNEKYVGKPVRAKVSEQKLIEKVEADDDVVRLVSEFVENGGTILAVEDRRIQIEVESGEFWAPRFCVKIQKD